MAKTGYVYDPLYLLHDQPMHPENRTRLDAIVAHLQTTGLLDRLQQVPARDATDEQITRVHQPHYVGEVKEWSVRGRRLDADTYVTTQSYPAALRAAGGVVAAVDAVLSGEVDDAFALVRPPGHHAVAGGAMGFCLFNNVAIAARHALVAHGLSRVLIVDFDLHHGNGTQEAFYSEQEVLYFSSHQYPYYPGSGHWEDVGRGPGRGYTVNVPLPAGTGDAGFWRVFDEILVPIAQRYRPQLILVSAGYDGHWMDPLGMMHLSVAGYVQITRILASLARSECDGRLVLALEGGYSLPALAHCVGAAFRVLLGDDECEDPFGPAQSREASVDEVLAAVKRTHGLALPGTG